MAKHFEPAPKQPKMPRVGTTSGSGGAEYFEKPAVTGGGGGGDVPIDEGPEPGLEGTESGPDNPVRGED